MVMLLVPPFEMAASSALRGKYSPRGEAWDQLRALHSADPRHRATDLEKSLGALRLGLWG